MIYLVTHSWLFKMFFTAPIGGGVKGRITRTTLQSVMNAKLSKHRFWHCQAHRDDSNDTPQPIGECQVSFPLGDVL